MFVLSFAAFLCAGWFFILEINHKVFAPHLTKTPRMLIITLYIASSFVGTNDSITSCNFLFDL
jgi:hypothetical protein